MAEVYYAAGGYQMEELIARHRDVQDWLDEAAGDIGRAARSNLAAHRDSGDAYIETHNGEIDRYIVLSDERGQSAAMSIEYGRGPGDGPMPFALGTQGTWVLHDAARLRKKNVRPNSRRKKVLRP